MVLCTLVLEIEVCPHVTDFAVDETALSTIMSLGFTCGHAIRALRETENNVERAADWGFNHPVDSTTEMDVDVTPSIEGTETVAETGEQNENNFSKWTSYT